MTDAKGTTPDLTPTYIASCRECDGFIGASVADPQCPDSVGRAAADYRNWKRRGYTLTIGTVQDVRDRKGPLGHTATCSKHRPKQQQLAESR